MAQHPRINYTIVKAISKAKYAKNASSAGSAAPYYCMHNDDRPDKAFTTDRAKKAENANASSGRIFVIVTPDHFGPILVEYDPERNIGVRVGETWKYRLECRQWSVHLPLVAGIAGQAAYGAQSVVISGGYKDDDDHGEWFFTLEGRAMQTNLHLLLIKVSGMMEFIELRNVGERLVSSEEHGDRPRPLPNINKELQSATDIEDRKEHPSWYYDDKEGWKWMVPPPVSRKPKLAVNPETKKKLQKTDDEDIPHDYTYERPMTRAKAKQLQHEEAAENDTKVALDDSSDSEEFCYDASNKIGGAFVRDEEKYCPNDGSDGDGDASIKNVEIKEEAMQIVKWKLFTEKEKEDNMMTSSDKRMKTSIVVKETDDGSQVVESNGIAGQ
ncbi:hypothetical protein PR202_gb00814 [Eleusine coracana subsp. coracana]|uniref:YDG domain-containing protein n=1 Tax=Eleusine coracana subsp. coracana TaxID=191504 RepID=A0AAV5DSI5_ELECO|nr:hypothetical protein PR202_gb00814 [Eleusine coracana subsp. coracana]